METAKDSGYRPLFNHLLYNDGVLHNYLEMKAVASEDSQAKKHESMLAKYEALKKANALTAKELKQRRKDGEMLEEEIKKRLSKKGPPGRVKNR